MNKTEQVKKKEQKYREGEKKSVMKNPEHVKKKERK